MICNMESDTYHRLCHTLNIMRACRIFNNKFIATISINELHTELVKLHHLVGHETAN